MRLPKHLENISRERVASAPYNFVPLPEKVVCAIDDPTRLPAHNSFANEGFPHSGYFEVSLTTMSPLYIRCPVTVEKFVNDDDQAKNSPDFFHTRETTRPVIPGSSLRGMLRSLLEIAGYGKMQGVSDRKLFFRSVGSEAVGRYYTNSIGTTSERNITRGYGFARWRGRGEWEIEECDVARVNMSLVASKFGNGQTDPDRALYTKPGPAGVPLDSIQHQQVLVTLKSADSWSGRGGSPELPKVEDLRKATEPAQSTRERIGTLVLTGPMTGKKKAFVFMPRVSGFANYIKIPNDQDSLNENEQILNRFNDDQMTRWQKDAFPPIKKGQPGALRDGDPVFYIIENGRLVFFGRAFLFRLPYQNSPLDMVAEALRNPDKIDYAEALFGFINGGNKSKASFAGRVSITDAKLNTGQSEIWLSENPITPRILSTPKPSTIQHYLVQRTESKEKLAHYGDRPVEKTVIRGFKRYWHQGLGKGMSVDEIMKAIAEKHESLNSNGIPDGDTQHTKMRPLRHGISFRFRVYFDNLSDRELGALCWILQPPGDEAQNYCHHLGMGKPLGLGAVKLESRLIRTNRKSRYGGLFDQGWLTGSDQEGENLADRPTLEKLTESFERHILTELKLDQQCQRLRELKRIGMLLKTMEWPGFLPAPTGARYLVDRPNTRYMSIKTEFMRNENEFRNRPVLPTPAAFGKLSGEVEPNLDLETKTKTAPPLPADNRATGSPSGKEADEAESICLAIKNLRLPGEVSLVEGIVLRIEALADNKHRLDSAENLKSRLLETKIKDKHKEKPWWKSLIAILGE